MLCPKCQRSVPDESTFCLGCGTRLAPEARLVSGNGDGAPAAGAAGPVTEGVGAGAWAAPVTATAASGARQAYALSFRPIVDERLRYRVARWVVERAPAHALREVQERLLRGDFVTFLALTSAEAEAVRQGIQRLGLPPALCSLSPATAAAFLPERPARKAGPQGSPGVTAKQWRGTIGVLIGLFLFGLVIMRLFGGHGF